MNRQLFLEDIPEYNSLRKKHGLFLFIFKKKVAHDIMILGKQKTYHGQKLDDHLRKYGLLSYLLNK